MVRIFNLFTFLCLFFVKLPSQEIVILPGNDTVIQLCTPREIETKVLTLTFNGGAKIKKIPIPGGYSPFTQLCTTEIDSVIRNGNVGFKHSKVGKIKDCFYQQQIRNDTLKAIVIITENAKNTQSAIEQANLQFGTYTETIEKDLTIYNWNLVRNNSITNCTLIMPAEGSTGVMTISKK